MTSFIAFHNGCTEKEAAELLKSTFGSRKLPGPDKAAIAKLERDEKERERARAAKEAEKKRRLHEEKSMLERALAQLGVG